MKKIARKAQGRKVSFTGPVWVGVDVHKKSYAVTILDKEGICTLFSMPADNQALVARLRSLTHQVACVAYEAGPCGYSLYRTAREAGFPALSPEAQKPIVRIVANVRNMPPATC